MNNTCRNHSNTPAKRRCFSCKTWICPDCQLKAHHHIFCSENCSNGFARKNKESPGLPTQLQDLDRSLTEDIHESRELIKDGVHDEFERFENNLDVALTSLATMVEGSAVAVTADVEKSTQQIESVVKEIERNSIVRDGNTQDGFEKLKTLALSLRENTFDLRERIEKVHGQLEHDVELLQSRLSHLDHQQKEHLGQGEKFFRFLGTAEEKLLFQVQKESEVQNKKVDLAEKIILEKIQENHKSFEDGKSILKSELSKQLEKLQKLWEEGQGTQQAALQNQTQGLSQDLSTVRKDLVEKVSHIEEKVHSTLDLLNRFHVLIDAQGTIVQESQKHFETQAQANAKVIQEAVQKELRRVVDDIASVTVAHRGNWNDVLKSAKVGVEKVTADLRPEILQKIKGEVQAITDRSSKEITQTIQEVRTELKNKIHKPLQSNPWKPFAYAGVGLVVGFLATLALVPKQINSNGTDSQEMAEIDSKLNSFQDSLKDWIENRLKNSKSSENNSIPQMVPFPASTRGNIHRKEMAFTFDGDDNNMAASAILDTLKSRNLHVTMFLTGKFISIHPELVKRIVDEGHEIGNHTIEHDPVVDPKTRKSVYSRAVFLNRLTSVEEKFRATTGHEMAKLWRAPYGELNDEVISWAASIGYRHVGWSRSGRNSLDSLDWVETPKNKLYLTADQIVEKISKFEKTDPNGLNGGIVLMHLGTLRTSDYPYQKLPELFDHLTQKGYQILKVSEVLRTDVGALKSP